MGVSVISLALSSTNKHSLNLCLMSSLPPPLPPLCESLLYVEKFCLGERYPTVEGKEHPNGINPS